MEYYRGKPYTIVQGIEPRSWIWTVYLDENTVRSGASLTRAAATVSVMWQIDNALAPIKRKPVPPSDEAS
jgi:hypothetical protein